MARRRARAGGRWVFGAAFCCAGLGVAGRVGAQVEEGGLAPEPAPVAAGPAVAADPLLQEVVWSRQRVRWFGSAELDTGFLYLRPRFSAGYGRPHDTWIGIDTNPIFS